MARFGFCGPSYSSQSLNVDAQRTVNWYPELVESQQGKGAIALYPTPGLILLYNLGTDPVRGLYTVNGRSFAVAGTFLFELLANGTSVNRGNVGTDGLPVSIVGGPGQILVSSAGLAYVLNLSTNAFTALNPNLFLGPVGTVEFTDAVYIAMLKGSNQWQYSAQNDATSWPGLNATGIQAFTDSTVGLIVDHREPWFFGPKKIVPYYNSGNLFTFDVVLGGILEQGCAAQFSPTRLDNSIFWIGGDERGNGIGWRAQGYNPVRITNHAIEFAWQGYPTIADAVCYGYQDQGHSFWVCMFPSAEKTWVYDVATNMWHERGFWNSSAALFTRQRAQYHTFNFNKHLVGDPTTGNIYQMGINFLTDFGNPIRRVRRSPHISKELQWMFFSDLIVDLEVGLGALNPSGIILQASDGGLWQLSINDDGTLKTIKVPNGAVTGILKLNDPTSSATWQVGVNTSGMLTTTSITLDATQPTAVPLTTNTQNFTWNLGVTLGGVLNTSGKTLAVANPQIIPQVMMRFSDDGAKTWSNERTVGAGALGQYRARVRFSRLGRSRGRTTEITVSDACPWRIADAYMLAESGYEPSERLTKEFGKRA